MQVAGLEPARCCHRGILSPLRLPIPPHLRTHHQYIIDEWCREFYMEGRRRSDLIRFGLFTGDKYVWDFKGGVAEGKSVENFFNVYPIPADDINGNKNLTQNPRY